MKSLFFIFTLLTVVEDAETKKKIHNFLKELISIVAKVCVEILTLLWIKDEDIKSYYDKTRSMTKTKLCHRISLVLVDILNRIIE